MPPTGQPPTPLMLIGGDDEFTVQSRAREVFQRWCQEVGGMDHEVIDGTAGNNAEASKILGRLREALLTLPFFGSGKVVWLKDCNFLGEEIAGSQRVRLSEGVTEELNELAALLKNFQWQSVRLLISAGRVDKRRTLYKIIEKTGAVEWFAALSLETKDWEERAAQFAVRQIQRRGKGISEEALGELVEAVGPNLALLDAEVEKLSLFIGERAEVQVEDVRQVVSRQKLARAFALGDAVGERNLPAVLRHLDEELWLMQFDKKRSEIGLLYGLLQKVRAMVMAKALVQEGLLRPGSDYRTVKAQMEKWPAERFAQEKKFSPLGLNPFVLFRALQHSANYTLAELVGGMEILLEANVQLVTSGREEAMVLQQALVRLVGTQGRGRERQAV